MQQKLLTFLTWGRQGKEGKPSCSCDRAIGVLGAASLQGLGCPPPWVCSRGVTPMVASCCHPKASDRQQ